ncbi:hypothetical protein LJB98_01925 [Bacteroidales bacterium OttesenSCG-928-M11]|nr:hypothetical protein [Bacteroidales bacterium OttesenSCG-928-M11]
MNNKTKNILFYICSTLLVISAVLFYIEKVYTPYLYAIAGAGVAVVLLASPYNGENIRLKRLNIQQSIAAILLPLSSYFMFKGSNEWYVLLLVSAVLILYTSFVRDYELKKERENGENNKPSE